MLCKQKPDIGQCNIDHVEKKVQKNKESAMKLLRRVNHDPETVRGDIKHGGSDEDQRYRLMVAVFQLPAHIEQHERKSQKQKGRSQCIGNGHIVFS